MDEQELGNAVPMLFCLPRHVWHGMRFLSSTNKPRPADQMCRVESVPVIMFLLCLSVFVMSFKQRILI